MAELLDGEGEQLMSDDAFQTRQIPLRQLKAEHPRVSLQQVCMQCCGCNTNDSILVVI